MVDNLKIEYDIQTNRRFHPDLVLLVIGTFNYHPTISKIKKLITGKGMLFSFNYTTQEKTCKTLQNLDKEMNMSRK